MDLSYTDFINGFEVSRSYFFYLDVINLMFLLGSNQACSDIDLFYMQVEMDQAFGL